MKKVLLFLVICILALPIVVDANVKLATVINDAGNKLVVVVGSKIPAGYRLMTNNLGIALPQNIWSKRNMVGTKSSPYNFTSGLVSTSTIFGDYGFDTLSLNIKVNNTASTTNTISFAPAYSNDDGCASSTDSNINWFTGTSTTGTLTQIFQGTSTVTMLKYNLTGLATQCVRLVTTASIATSTIWVEGLLK